MTADPSAAQEVSRMRKSIYGIVAVALAMSLVGCGAQGSSLAGKEADSLSVTPAADTVIETVAANGKTYDYFWWGRSDR